MSDISSVLLPTEYQAALARVQRIEERLFSISIGGGLLALGAAAYGLINRAELEIGPAWLLPLPFILTAAVLLGLFSARLAAQTHVQALRHQSGGIPDLVQTAAPYPPFLRRLMLLPGLGLVALYLLTVLFCLRAVYSTSHAAGTIFGLGYGLLSTVLCLAAVAVWRHWHAQPAITFGTIRQVLLPDPGDLLLGFALFTAGFLSPAATVGLNAAQLGVINALFRRAVDFTDSVPWAAAAALGLCYFAVLEGLLVPAGRYWTKMRRAEPGSRGYAQIIVRLMIAFPLAYALGGLPLLVLCILFWLQQAGAVLNSSPNTPADAALPAKRQIARLRFSLLWDGLRSALRFYGGVLVWVGSAWSFTFLLLLFCAVAFLGVAFRAAWNARQARMLVLRGEETYSAYDLNHAPRWQRAGFLAAGLTALGLTMLQILAETNDYYNSSIAAGYGRFNNSAVEYSQAGMVNGLLLTLDLLLFGLLACVLYVRLLRPAGPFLTLGLERGRAWLIPLLLAISLGLAIASAVTGLYSLVLGGLLSATLCAALWCER